MTVSFDYETYCVRATITLMVTSDANVVIDTRFTASFSSLPNMTENMAVFAATGAETDIMRLVSMDPLTPIR